MKVPLSHSTNKSEARLGDLMESVESSYHHNWRARLEALVQSDPTMEEMLGGLHTSSIVYT